MKLSESALALEAALQAAVQRCVDLRVARAERAAFVGRCLLAAHDKREPPAAPAAQAQDLSNVELQELEDTLTAAVNDAWEREGWPLRAVAEQLGVCTTSSVESSPGGVLLREAEAAPPSQAPATSPLVLAALDERAVPENREAATAVAGARVSEADHKAVALLAALDEFIISAILSGAIKLLDADFLRGDAVGDTIARRQDLEARERESGVRIFLPPDVAVAALRSYARAIGSLTYGWTTREHPDPSGTYLAAVRRYLRSALGAHIRGVFWDFASLPQKPRDEPEDALFAVALSVMGDVYASALGTTVMRHRAVPPRPAALDGEAVVLVAEGGRFDAADDEAELRRALGGAIESARLVEGQHEWRVRFASHAALEALEAGAAPAEGIVAVFAAYNGREYHPGAHTVPALPRHPVHSSH